MSVDEHLPNLRKALSSRKYWGKVKYFLSKASLKILLMLLPTES